MKIEESVLLMETFDDLAGFKIWWEERRPFNTPTETPVMCYDAIYGVVLYRQAPYQVQLFIMPPDSFIEDHIHPNVDSYEVFLGGDIIFRCNGEEHVQDVLGASIRVLPNSWHGGKFGKRGGSFLSIQKWLNNVPPTSVGNDWHDAANNTAGTATVIKD
jgi:quercetin dioxygenase-like cupin family protein